MTLAAYYDTCNDLAAYWRPLTDAESARAFVLLGAAADLINEQDGAANFKPTALKWVSLDMVKRAMLSRGDGVTQVSQGMADMSSSTTYANPAGNLYITAKELRRLFGKGGPRAFSLQPSTHTRVSGYPWSWQPSSQDENITPPYLPYYPYPYP